MQEMRLVERKDKNGTPLVIGFAEFVDAQHANVALKALQVSYTLPSVLYTQTEKKAVTCALMGLLNRDPCCV